MATPNSKGGWDLTDDDVAEVMSQSFGHLDTSLDDIKTAIGECAGYVSLCWEPMPDGVFDSTAAAAKVEEAVALVMAALQAQRDEFVRMENAWRDEVDRRERAAWEVNDTQMKAAGYREGYAAAMDDGWGDPGHVKAETERIVGIIKAYYAVAPKAAEPLLAKIEDEP